MIVRNDRVAKLTVARTKAIAGTKPKAKPKAKAQTQTQAQIITNLPPEIQKMLSSVPAEKRDAFLVQLKTLTLTKG